MLKGHRTGLDRQVETTLILLGQDMSQTVVADMFGISQPSVCRIRRRIPGFLEAVTMFTGISLERPLTQSHLVLIDASLRPHRQPARHRPPRTPQRTPTAQLRRHPSRAAKKRMVKDTMNNVQSLQ